MALILLVEDEPAIADTLVYALRSECHEVRHVLNGEDALAAEGELEHDLAILDVGLPDMTGFDLCGRLREKRRMPILFLTARAGEIDRVLGLEMGGDDYVTKPFSPREVAARVKAILRRSAAGEDVKRTYGDDPGRALRVDWEGKQVVCDGVELDLTAYEFRLACALIERPGQVFSREQLLEKAWDDPGAVTDRTIDAHVKSLRAKIRRVSESSAECIETRRGLGYLYRPGFL